MTFQSVQCNCEALSTRDAVDNYLPSFWTLGLVSQGTRSSDEGPPSSKVLMEPSVDGQLPFKLFVSSEPCRREPGGGGRPEEWVSLRVLLQADLSAE